MMKQRYDYRQHSISIANLVEINLFPFQKWIQTPCINSMEKQLVGKKDENKICIPSLAGSFINELAAKISINLRKTKDY